MKINQIVKLKQLISNLELMMMIRFTLSSRRAQPLHRLKTNGEEDKDHQRRQQNESWCDIYTHTHTQLYVVSEPKAVSSRRRARARLGGHSSFREDVLRQQTRLVRSKTDDDDDDDVIVRWCSCSCYCS